MLSHLKCGGGSPRAPRGVAYCGDSRVSPNTFRSSPASSSMFFCRCPLAFSPSSHSRRPHGKFARPAGPFLLHPDGPHRKPFVSMGAPDPWGSIINPIWAAHLADVEEAWERATEPNPEHTSSEPPISPPLHQPEAPLKDVLVSPQLVESLVRVLSPLRLRTPRSPCLLLRCPGIAGVF